MLASALHLTCRRLGRCEYVITALGSSEGVADLWLPTFPNVVNTGGASLDESFLLRRSTDLEARYAARVELRRQRVPVVRLDQLELVVGFVKLDVEGFESQVLEGAAETLARCQPIVVLEILHSSPAAMEFLVDLGYCINVIVDGNLQPSTTDQALSGGHLDAVAMPLSAPRPRVLAS